MNVSPARCSQFSALARPLAGAGLVLSLFLTGALPTEVRGQNAYRQHNLVSDLPGKADRTDTNLVNPWGIATSATSPFWVSDNHAGLSTLYNSTGGVVSLVVNIPPPPSGQPPAAPTGMVFNGNAKSFLIGTNRQPARFIFSTEDGTIAAWNSGTNALLEVDQSGANAIYKGLAIATVGGSNFLYATDFHNGKVDVFDSAFQPVALPGAFVDPNLPAGYAPFNVQNLGNSLYVTYALPDANKEDDVGGPGHGYVNVFDTSGQFVKRFTSEGPLNSPWGLALAPSGFGQFSGALLIGNFGDGMINAFDPATGSVLGHLQDESGKPIVIEGLWGLKFGNGGQGGDPFKVYFSAGISGGGSIEDHGLFGSIEVANTITLATIQVSTNTLNLQWTGGTPPYLVQRKTSFTDTNWFDVLTTTNLSVRVPRDADTAFYRVTDHSSKVVTPFTVWMSDAVDVPGANGPGRGFGLLSLEGNTLSYRIAFSGLTGPAMAAHIHGPSNATNSAGVITPLNPPAAAEGVIEGSVDISSYTAAQMTDLHSGNTYVNIHTAAHPGGEVRGQVAPLTYGATLNGAQETPPVTTTGSGQGVFTLVGNELFWDVSYTNLSSSAKAAHIHGPAAPGTPAGVLFGIGNPTGTSGSLTGSQVLTISELNELLDGVTYVNVHTSQNSGGEIRGQILPQ